MWYNEYLSGFTEDFIKNYNEINDVGYFLEVDLEYPKKICGSNKDLCRKLKNLFVVQKKEKYVIHIRALKLALSNGLKLKKGTQSN